MSRLTVIVPTYNEESMLRECLESVRFADEVFVVDSFSTDRTLEIAREFTDRIVQHEYVNSAAQKNWAIPQVKSDWIMVLDADERVTPELRARIEGILADGTPYDGFYVRRMTIFFGKLIRHCGWHRDYLVRLWRNGKGRYEDLEVHADVIVDGRVGTIREHLLHDTYRSFAHYLEKFDRYSTLSANDLYKQGRKASWVNLTIRPLWRFFRMYVVRHGFLDGKHGLLLCTLAAFSVFMKYAKLWDRQRRESLTAGDQAGPGLRIQGGSQLSPDELENALAAHDEALEGRGTVLRRSRHGAVTKIDLDGQWLCVKQYAAEGARQRLKDWLRRPRADRAWCAAQRLQELGISAPEALALVERGRTRYVVMRFVHDGVPLDRLLGERFAGDPSRRSLVEKRRLLRALGRWLRQIHDAGIYHGDWSAKNILVAEREGSWEFLLVDLESIAPERRLSRRRRVKNLGQVCDVPGGLTAIDRMRCLIAYADGDRTFTRGRFTRRVVESARRRARRRARRQQAPPGRKIGAAQIGPPR